MSISIVLSPKVRFKVEGIHTSEAGASVPFGFWLTGERLADTAAVRELQKQVRTNEEAGSQTPVTDALVPRFSAWEDVKDLDGTPVPFSEASLRALLNQTGLAMKVFVTYLGESGAKEKN